VLFQSLSSLGVEDTDEAAEALECIEFGLLLRFQGAGTRFPREVGHADMIALGKPQSEKRAGGTGRNFSLKLKASLPDGRAGVGSHGAGFHVKDCMLVAVCTEG